MKTLDDFVFGVLSLGLLSQRDYLKCKLEWDCSSSVECRFLQVTVAESSHTYGHAAAVLTTVHCSRV